MKHRLKTGIAFLLLPEVLVVKWLGNHPDWIEEGYSNGLYVFVSRFFRYLFGWVPFSVGDILYFLLTILAIRFLIIHRHTLRKRKWGLARDILMVLSVAYLTFHLCWGMNYYRMPLAEKLGLEETHDRADVYALATRLVKRTNELQTQLTGDSLVKVDIHLTKGEIYERTVAGYRHLEGRFPFLSYHRPSIKTSMFSTMLSYMGYGGYLNPFTNEGQVNGKLPLFRLPVVAGHEIGHQIGYSAENETNFIGYLVTASNPDSYFQYAANAYALGYCLNDIRKQDEEAFQRYFNGLHPGVRENYQEMADFWSRYENPLEPVFKSIFDSFLKANNQTEGIETYNLVVSLLVAYHRDHPL